MNTTDLAFEANEEWSKLQKAEQTHAGIVLRTEDNMKIIEVRSREGSEAISKPIGTYYSIEIPLSRYELETMHTAEQIAAVIGRFLPKEGTVLIAGLGNRYVTPDALGPNTVKHILITNHLTGFSFRPVASIAPDVKAITGIDSAKAVQAAANEIGASCILAIDALAANALTHLGRIVQISNAGIAPGSGVGNAQEALTKESTGVDVISIGVPMVIAGQKIQQSMGAEHAGLIVTPSDIDVRIRRLSWLLGTAINYALQPTLNKQEVLDLMQDGIM